MEPALARRLVGGLRDAGITFVSYLPETRLSQILPLVSIAAGASLGGTPAAVYMEGSGVYVASYNLLVIGKRLGVPMLLIVAHYGSMMDRRNSFLYASPGLHLPANLESLNIPYEVLEDGNHLENKIQGAVRMMHAIKQPVALLFTGEFTV
jgi:sulfopyruvate decarboxylase TPP-binding subunit